MEKHFVTYKQALALKKLGYDEPCFGRYQIGGDFVLSHTERYVISNGTDRTKYFILRPLKSQVFEWFRKEYSGIANIQHYGGLRFPDICFNFEITAVNNAPSKILSRVFDTYEEAESACIDKLIELLQHDK